MNFTPIPARNGEKKQRLRHKNVWRKIDFNDLKVTMKMMETDPYADQVQTDDVAEGQ